MISKQSEHRGVGAVVGLVCAGLLAGASACATSPERTASTTTNTAMARASSSPYPIRLLAARSRTPTLFMSSETGAPVVAAFNTHVEVLVLGPSENGRVPVQVEGDLPMRGYIPETDVLARVQRGGDVEGTPVHVTSNDLVHVLALRPDGMAVVRAGAERLLAFDHSPRVLVRALDPNHPGFVGAYPMARLGATRVTTPEDARAPGSQVRLTRRVEVLSAPDGAPLRDGAYDTGIAARLVGERDGYGEVLIGLGPYVRGYVPLDAIATVPEAEADAQAELAPSDDDAPFHHPLVALVHHDERGAELVQIPAGTTVTIAGRPFTTASGPGYARVLARAETDADALVTVSGAIVVRGRVPIDALGETATVPPARDGRVAAR